MRLSSASWWIVVPVVVLSAISLLILNSVASGFVTAQLVFVVVGMVAMLALSQVDYQLYIFSPWPWYGLSLAVLILTLLLGEPIQGAVRWITLGGVSIQTSELAKPMMILFMAIYLAQNKLLKVKDVLVYGLLCLVPIGLIFLQPDLGTAIIFGLLTLASMVAAGMEFKKLAVLLLAAVLVIPIGFNLLRPYQRQRIESFVNPASDPLGAGYNSLQATIAVGSGRFFGRGLGQGTQSHLRFLPERYSDFIFASLVEELGFVGGGVIIALYLAMAWGLIRAARMANSDTGSIVLMLTLFLLLIQTFVNVGMNMGILPITGITLPLVSAGGSSYLSVVILLGLCLSIANQTKQKGAELELK